MRHHIATLKTLQSYSCRDGDSSHSSNRIAQRVRPELESFKLELEALNLGEDEIYQKVSEKQSELTQQYLSQYRKYQELLDLRKERIRYSDPNRKEKSKELDEVNIQLQSELMHQFSTIFGGYPDDFQISKSTFSTNNQYFTSYWSEMEKRAPFDRYTKYKDLFYNQDFEDTLKEALVNCLS